MPPTADTVVSEPDGGLVETEQAEETAPGPDGDESTTLPASETDYCLPGDQASADPCASSTLETATSSQENEPAPSACPEDAEPTGSLHVDSYPDPNEDLPALAESGASWRLGVGAIAMGLAGVALMLVGSARTPGKHR